MLYSRCLCFVGGFLLALGISCGGSDCYADSLDWVVHTETLGYGAFAHLELDNSTLTGEAYDVGDFTILTWQITVFAWRPGEAWYEPLGVAGEGALPWDDERLCDARGLGVTSDDRVIYNGRVPWIASACTESVSTEFEWITPVVSDGTNSDVMGMIGDHDSAAVGEMHYRGVGHWELTRGGRSPVPEPSSMILLGMGLASLGVCRKKFKKA